MIGKILLHIGKNRSKARQLNKLGLFQTQLGGLAGAATLRKFYSFYPHLNWHKINI